MGLDEKPLYLEGVKEGRKQERAAVMAFLREYGDSDLPPQFSAAFRMAHDGIEDGDHLNFTNDLDSESEVS